MVETSAKHHIEERSADADAGYSHDYGLGGHVMVIAMDMVIDMDLVMVLITLVDITAGKDLLMIFLNTLSI